MGYCVGSCSRPNNDCKSNQQARRHKLETIDLAVVDVIARQTFEGLLDKIADVLGLEPVIDESKPIVCNCKMPGIPGWQ